MVKGRVGGVDGEGLVEIGRMVEGRAIGKVNGHLATCRRRIEEVSKIPAVQVRVPANSSRRAAVTPVTVTTPARVVNVHF